MNKGTLSIVGVVVFAILILLFMSFTVVSPGTVGVVVRLGAVQNTTLPEGTHIVTPFITSVVLLNVRIQKLEVDATASSKDLQNVTSKVALNFQLANEKANVTYKNLGLDYSNSIIHPTIQESIKSATAKFTAEELITKRAQVKDDVYTYIKKRLGAYNITVTEFSIVDFSFSPEFNKAIEAKEVAKQKAITAKNDLERIKAEADQNIEEARGKSESQKLLTTTLDDKILQLKAIEKWDGVLPVVQGDAGNAFIDVAAIRRKK
jgi:regulator of protease activity HflC (stomatin/prohibitin superfamily)